ncbi:AraC family transcriptional regulator [Lichenibacterium dinghuense]|uniref:AraC family transcriptional regulator n=1 Tax=Lichenibacterium dinghuense TaxID=2895977 RepID=UPI001F3F2381|nr:AraC family transcriptional regulator [Lichenibacterium sp. 6Y81]
MTVLDVPGMPRAMRPDPVHLRFGPDTHPPDERVEAWRSALGFSHDMMVAPEDRADFRASFDGHHLGSILLADMRSGPHTAVRDKAHIARHALDAVALDVFVEGGLVGRVGTHNVAVGPGDALLLDLRDTMHIDVAEHRCVTLVVPRPLFTERVKRAGAVGGRMLAAGTPEARLLAGQLLHLLNVAADLSEALAEAAGLAALDLLAACLAPRPGRRKRESQRKDRAPELARVERFIERNIAKTDLGPEAVCAHFRLSRTALYRLIQPLGGVAAVAHRHRTLAAHRLLTSEWGRDLAIDEVARRCGFGTGQSLRRAMADAYGASPREIRKAAVVLDDAPPPVDPETSAWVDADFTHTAP